MDAHAFRPSSDGFGHPVASVMRCRRCGHGSVSEYPDPDSVTAAYADAADPVSVREEAGQVETADRALVEVERFIRPGAMVDVGSWTGSMLVAAQRRGWEPVGIEPSRWAAQRSRERGATVYEGDFLGLDIEAGGTRLVTFCDVLEHLEDPGAAVDCAARLLAGNDAGLYITVPDAGSALARAMGRRWWSVLPMHVQYFTRSSLVRLLEARGFRIRSLRSHAKVFTARYYAERLGGYSGSAGALSVATLGRLGLQDRLVAPDFRDRMAVVATR